jgi:hypothetical protein
MTKSLPFAKNYQISLQGQKPVYIGKTKYPLSHRLQQHKTKTKNLELKQWLKDNPNALISYIDSELSEKELIILHNP